MTLRDQIIQAFSHAPQPRPGNVSVPTYDDEGTADYFTGKSWHGHPVEKLRWHEVALCFFTPAAFRYYLPAFMLAELDDPQTADVIAGGILFHLTDPPRCDTLLREFTDAEREAVARFFDDCATRYAPDPSFKSAADQMRQPRSQTRPTPNPP